jgi:hypothetical protein
VDALEKHISNAAESFFSFSPASRGAFLFFRAHRKVPRAQPVPQVPLEDRTAPDLAALLSRHSAD